MTQVVCSHCRQQHGALMPCPPMHMRAAEQACVICQDVHDARLPCAGVVKVKRCIHCGWAETDHNPACSSCRARLEEACRRPTHGANMGAVSEQPFGDVTEAGRKKAKVRLELVNEAFPLALMDLARVMTWAITIKGYKEGDWANVPNAIQEYRGAFLRHDNKECAGAEFDEESELLHATHTAWNAVARLELILRGKKCVPPTND